MNDGIWTMTCLQRISNRTLCSVKHSRSWTDIVQWERIVRLLLQRQAVEKHTWLPLMLWILIPNDCFMSYMRALSWRNHWKLFRMCLAVRFPMASIVVPAKNLMLILFLQPILPWVRHWSCFLKMSLIISLSMNVIMLQPKLTRRLSHILSQSFCWDWQLPQSEWIIRMFLSCLTRMFPTNCGCGMRLSMIW